MTIIINSLKFIMLAEMLLENRHKLICNIKSRTGKDQASIILLKGSSKLLINDTNNYYDVKYESNFVYLFGIN